MKKFPIHKKSFKKWTTEIACEKIHTLNITTISQQLPHAFKELKEAIYQEVKECMMQLNAIQPQDGINC